MNFKYNKMKIVGLTSIIVVILMGVFIFTQIGPYNKNNSNIVINVKVNKNTNFGVFGELEDLTTLNIDTSKKYKIALRNEIKEGKAYILSNIEKARMLLPHSPVTEPPIPPTLSPAMFRKCGRWK